MTSRAPYLTEIGSGSCGIVYAFSHLALKRARRGQEQNLWNDFLMHTKIREAISRYGQAIAISVPEITAFALGGGNNDWWRRYAGHFPLDAREDPECVLLSERIPPVERALRDLLVERFCPEEQKGAVRAKRENEDCLVRVCLGEVDACESKSVLRKGGQLQTTFSLRNFPVTLTKLNAFHDDVPWCEDRLTKSIAQALALLHWSAQVDARDVEFVLATAPPPPLSYTHLSQMHRPTSTVDDAPHSPHPPRLWLLDFNQVKQITMDAKGVEAAVAAFFDNKPKYYPRPSSGHAVMDHLWGIFKAAYLAESAELLSCSTLPRTFIDRIEEREQARAECAKGARPK